MNDLRSFWPERSSTRYSARTSVQVQNEYKFQFFRFAAQQQHYEAHYQCQVEPQHYLPGNRRALDTQPLVHHNDRYGSTMTSEKHLKIQIRAPQHNRACASIQQEQGIGLATSSQHTSYLHPSPNEKR